MKTKRCSKCGETKPESEFYPNRKPSHGRPGLKSACKGCDIAQERESRKPAPPPKPPLPTAAELSEWYRTGCRVA